jgi:hypothetical protein
MVSRHFRAVSSLCSFHFMLIFQRVKISKIPAIKIKCDGASHKEFPKAGLPVRMDTF